MMPPKLVVNANLQGFGAELHVECKGDKPADPSRKRKAVGSVAMASKRATTDDDREDGELELKRTGCTRTARDGGIEVKPNQTKMRAPVSAIVLVLHAGKWVSLGAPGSGKRGRVVKTAFGRGVVSHATFSVGDVICRFTPDDERTMTVDAFNALQPSNTFPWRFGRLVRGRGVVVPNVATADAIGDVGWLFNTGSGEMDGKRSNARFGNVRVIASAAIRVGDEILVAYGAKEGGVLRRLREITAADNAAITGALKAELHDSSADPASVPLSFPCMTCLKNVPITKGKTRHWPPFAKHEAKDGRREALLTRGHELLSL